MTGKRIVFNTATTNDQGGIIPNEAIDFTRFNKNPVLLLEHQWGSAPLGMMTEIELQNGQYTGIPVFHKLTQASQEYGSMYEAGFVKACSIGGFSEWRTTAAGQPVLDRDGNRICAVFDLYEISICSLPSNMDAVTLGAKMYQRDEVQAVESHITALSSEFKLNNPTHMKTNGDVLQPNIDRQIAAKEQELNTLKAERMVAEKLHAGGVANVPAELPGVMQTILSFAKDLLGMAGKAKADAPAAFNPAKTDPDITRLLENVTLKSEHAAAAKAKMEAARKEADEAVEAVQATKEKAEAEDATDEHKALHQAALEHAEQAVDEAEKCEAEYKAVLEADDDNGDDDNAKKSTDKFKTTNFSVKPELKTAAEIKQQLKLAATPDHSARVKSQLSRGLTFTQLHTAWQKDGNSEEGRIFNRVMTTNSGGKDVADYAVLLNSIMNDGRYKAVVEKARINQNVNQAAVPSLMANPKLRAGLTLQQLSARLNAGKVTVLGRDNTLREQTTLNSTDSLLASPDLFAVEWLPLAIFQLFPQNSWKQDIPVFSAQETGSNTGLIWANVAADPQIYKGAQPSPSNYSYQDTAVALSLVPYWLQPMVWTPMTMHQLRYDMMSTGWAQAFAKWGAVMDDNLIYTLASTVPASSVIKTTGSKVAVASGSANSFYYNQAYSGNVLGMSYNDVFAVEQLFKNQNFELKNEKATIVLDPIMERSLKEDAQTSSLLTRWVKNDDGDTLKISQTNILDRSRVAVYDPATAQVKDPNASIPSTATSAGLAFIPSNVGIGLGMLDVFMTQSPGAYGYIMSADTRIGIVPLRANFDGTGLITYGSAS